MSREQCQKAMDMVSKDWQQSQPGWMRQERNDKETFKWHSKCMAELE